MEQKAIDVGLDRSEATSLGEIVSRISAAPLSYEPGDGWGYSMAIEFTVVALTNTALEGMVGRFPVDVRNAVYGV